MQNNFVIRLTEDRIKLKEIELTKEMVRRLLRRMQREEQEVATTEDKPKKGSPEKKKHRVLMLTNTKIQKALGAERAVGLRLVQLALKQPLGVLKCSVWT